MEGLLLPSASTERSFQGSETLVESRGLEIAPAPPLRPLILALVLALILVLILAQSLTLALALILALALAQTLILSLAEFRAMF